jgi:M6 family metalloprotease-like protein
MSLVICRRALALLFILTIAATASAQTSSITGQLSMLWGDPQDGAGEPQFSVRLLQGEQAITLQFADGAQPPFDQLHRLDGKLVSVRGQFAGPATGGAAGDSVFVVSSVDGLASAPAGAAAAPEPAPIFGAQPWITLRCKFNDSPGVEPAVNQSLLTGTGYPSVNHYYREASFGNMNLDGSAVAPWVVLPKPWASYNTSTGSANLELLAIDCAAAADPIVTFTNFVGINMMFNERLGGFWYGTSGRSFNIDGGTRTMRTTWIFLRDSFPAFLGGLVHEIGHGFGFPHSSGPYGQTYDSNWDVMSNSYPHYDAGINDYIPEGTISYHKDLDSWIPAARKFTASRNTSTAITLDRLVSPVGASYLMAQIPIPNTTNRFYTVELRIQTGYDTWVPGNGVIIHDVLTTRSSPALVVDPDNNSNPNDAGAMWTPGETFTDAANQISVAVLSLTTTSATVVITSGDPVRRIRPGDFDGDARTDVTIFRPSSRTWFTINSSNGAQAQVVWGSFPTDLPVFGDFDGDGKSDRAIYRPSDGTWSISRSQLGATTLTWGAPGDRPVPQDYDGDGRTDVAVYRPSTGDWYWIASSTGTGDGRNWGIPGDIPVVADFDGDRRADPAVYRPSTGTWYIVNSTGTTSSLVWGEGLDLPVPGDYDGDNLADIAVFRPSSGTWFVRYSSGGSAIVVWGEDTDLPVPGYYDADGRMDIAVYRPATATWYILNSSSGAPSVIQWGLGAEAPVARDFSGDDRSDVAVFRTQTGSWTSRNSATTAITNTTWGGATDIPVPGDYDGDGKADVAVYRPSNATWYVLRASGGQLTTPWGGAGDRPVPADYDGDGKTDFAVFRPSTGQWTIFRSGSGLTQTATWGAASDLTRPADYDGDGKADIAIYRPSTATWHIIGSITGSGYGIGWGAVRDTPVPADFDGDGKADAAVFRSSDGTWFVNRTAQGALIASWGTAGDIGVPSDYDGDGKADFAVYRPSTAQWFIYNSQTGTTSTITLTPPAWGNGADVPLLRRQP